MTDENEKSLGKHVTDWLTGRTGEDKFIDRLRTEPELFEAIFGNEFPNLDDFLEHMNETSKKMFNRELDDLNEKERIVAWDAAVVSRPNLFEAFQEESRKPFDSEESE